MPTIKIKICGITNVSDALAAAELGADAIGLNFYSGSSRFIKRKQAEEIIRELPPFVGPVGVFVNKSMERVRKRMHRVGLRTFQWYGEPWHSETQLAKLKKVAFNLNDYRKQFEQMVKTGGMKDLMSKMPGMGQVIPDREDPDETMSRVQRILDAMTEEERITPEIIDSERRCRIAKASGMEVHEVSKFLQQFEQMRLMMQQMASMSILQKIRTITDMGKAGMFQPGNKKSKSVDDQDLFQPRAVVPLRAIPAFPLRDEQSLKTITAHLAKWRSTGQLPAAILVDAHVPGSYGGTGQVAPWQLLSDFSPGVPLILAGGLTPDNVAQAIRTVRPYGVDVASGVESCPGKKDADKMRRFIEQARSVNL